MIGIIAAMQEEVDGLVVLMEDVAQTSHQGISFWEGTLSGNAIVLMMSGVGKVNAAMSSTVLCTTYDISAILNIGTAGGLIESQNVLDLVISTTVVQHDYDTSPVDGKEGYGLRFEADQHLLDTCKKVFQEDAQDFHIGEIASGDQFIAHEAQWQRILNLFPDAICAEMEAGAIAHVCFHFKIPFVVVRSLSDITTHPKSHMDFGTYVKKASKRSAKLCKEIVAIL